MGQTGKFSLFYLCIQDHLFPLQLHAGTYTVLWRIHYFRPLNEAHNCAPFSARHQRAPPLCRRKRSCLDHCFSAIAAHFFLDIQHFLSSDKWLSLVHLYFPPREEACMLTPSFLPSLFPSYHYHPTTRNLYFSRFLRLSEELLAVCWNVLWSEKIFSSKHLSVLYGPLSRSHDSEYLGFTF